MVNIKNIAIHHFGAPENNLSYKASVLQEADINILHKNRWPDFPSKLSGSFIGYNFIIWPDGTLKQYRYIGEETAAQYGHNKDTISICLAGNFTKGAELPTFEQKMKLKQVISALLDLSTIHNPLNFQLLMPFVLDLSKDRIKPHRFYQSNTACYGNALGDNWAEQLISQNMAQNNNENTVNELKEKLSLLQRLLALYQRMLELKSKLAIGFFGKKATTTACLYENVRG